MTWPDRDDYEEIEAMIARLGDPGTVLTIGTSSTPIIYHADRFSLMVRDAVDDE